MFVMDYYGHKLSNGVLFAHHLILDVPGGSSHLGYRRRVPPGHNPTTGVNGVRLRWLRLLQRLQGRTTTIYVLVQTTNHGVGPSLFA